MLVRLLAALDAHVLDDGYEAFQPSNLEITTVDIGNPATNVIPAEARAPAEHPLQPGPHRRRPDRLAERARPAGVQAETGLQITLEHMCSGEAFLTPPRRRSSPAVQDAVEAATGVRPEASTTGGTSDARFIRALCPVLELGLVGQTMHQVDERVPVAELEALTAAYRRVIETVLALWT